MPQKPDFYVKFGDNSEEWAASLKGPFGDVQSEISAINLALAGLDKNVRSKGGRLNKELTKHTGGLGTAIRKDLDSSADSLNAMVADLGLMMQGLKTLPSVLSKMRKRLLAQEKQLLREMTGDGQTHDAKGNFTGGRGGNTSQAQRFGAIIERSVQLGVEKGLGKAKIQAKGVRDVPKEAIDRGAADRIIKAIEKQTRQLIKGIGGGGGGGGGRPTNGEVSGAIVAKKPRKSRAKQAADEEVKAEKKKNTDLEAADAALTKAKQEHARKATKESKKQLDAIQKERDAIAKASAAKERSDRGISHATQREERRAKNKALAEERRASAPELTQKQKVKRRGQLELLQEAGDAGLIGRLGKKKGDVTVDRLKQIADALTKQGFNVPYSAHSKKEPLAEAVSKAGRQFWKSTGGEIPDSLRTDGRTVKVDEIPKRVKKLIGDVNRYVKSGSDLIEAQDLLRANAESGGRAPYLGDAPDRARKRVAKGAYTYGSAINEFGVPGEFAGTRAEVDAARAALKNPVTGPIYKLARQRAQDPKFNPYALDLTVKGKGPEAVSTRTALAGLRSATEHIDKIGKEFFQLSDAVKIGEQKIKDARAEIRKAEERLDSGELGKGQRRKATQLIDRRRVDIDRLSGAQDTLLSQMAAISKGGLGKVFRSPGYREGLSLREYAPSETYPSQREMFEGRIEALRQHKPETPAEIRQMATMQAIAGVRTAIGSKAVVGNIPGLRAVQGRRRNSYDLVGPDLDAASQNELRKSQQRYDSVQRKVQQGKFPKKTVDEIADIYENAAVRLAGTLHKLFGLAPSVKTLTGSDIRQEKNLAGEQERQAARDLSQDRLKKKIQKSYGPGEFLGEAETNVARNAAAQKAADKRRIAADDRLTQARQLEANEEERLVKKLTASQQKRRRALQRQLAAAEAEESAASQDITSQPGSARNLKHDAGLKVLREAIGPGFLPEGSEGPLTQAQIAANKLSGEAATRRDRLLAAQKSQRAIQGKIDQYGTSDPRVSTRIKNARLAAADAEKTLTEVSAALKKDKDVLQRVKQVMRLAAEGAEALGYTEDEAKYLRPEIGRQTGFTNKQVDQILRKKALPGPTILDEADRESRLKQEQAQLQERLQGILPLNKKGNTPTTQKGIEALDKMAKEAEALVTGRAGGALKSAVTRARNKGDVEGLHKAEETLRDRQAAATTLRGLATEATTARSRLKELHVQLSPTLTKEREATRAKTAETAAVKEATAAVNADTAKKKKAGGAGGDGGGKGPKGVAGADGEDGNIFRLMLAELKKINTALRNGVKTTGARVAAGDGKGGATGVARASAEELRLLQSENPADVKQAAALERERIKNATPLQQDRAKVQTVKDLAKAQKQSGEAARQQARDEEVLKKALSLVSDATRREIAELERLNKAGAKQAQVAKQQQKVYTAVADDLRYSTASRGRDDVARSILSSQNPGMSRAEFTNIKRSANAESGFTQIGTGWADEAMDGFAAHFGGRGFWNRILATTGTFIVRNFAAGFVFGITNALQDVITQAVQTEATFIRVSAALEASGQKVGNLRSDLQDISTEYGIALNDVYETAAGLTGLFDNASDTAAATKVVAQLQAISGGALNAQEAMGVLASTISAFSALPGEPVTDKLLPGGIEGFQKVADVLTVIQSTMGVNIETSAEGVSRMAGLARQMKLSFEETAVFVGQIAKQTNQTGAAAGEQFSRIIGALQTGRGRSAVQQAYGDRIAGPLAQGDYGEVFKVMIAGYDGLSDAEKRNLVVNVAGQRQAAAFNALMNNGAKTLNTLARAEDANGEAADRMAKLTKTLNSLLAQLRTNAQNLANELVRTGILNFLGLTLKVVNVLLRGLNDLLGTLNNFADNNAFLGFLRKGITGLLGFAVAFKLIQAATRGLKGAVTAAIPKEVRDARAARLAAREGQPLIGRPRYSSFGRPIDTAGTRRIPVGIASPALLEARQRRSYLARGVGFGLDRSVGVGFEAAARGLNLGAQKLAGPALEQGRAAKLLSRGGEGLIRAATALRTGAFGFQSLGGGGRGFGPLSGSSRLLGSQSAKLAAGAAERRAAYAAQQQFAKLGASQTAPALQQGLFRRGLAQQGLSPQQIGLRTAAPNSALLRQAKVMDSLGRVTGATSTGLGKLSGSLAKLGGSGALADGAMIGLAIGIAALIEGLGNQSRATHQLKEANAEFYAQTEEAKKALKDPTYYGRNYADFQQSYLPQLQDPLADDSFLGKFQEGLHGIGALLTQGNPVKTLFGLKNGDLDPAKHALAEAYGTSDDLSKSYGHDLAEQILEQGTERLDNVAGVGDDIRDVQEKLQKRIDKKKDDILSSDKSSRQKQAALASLEVVGRKLAEKAQDLAGIADGIDAKIGLTTQQIQSVQEYVSTLQSLGGGSGEFGTQLQGLYEETGVETGSRASRILERMANGGDSTTIAIGNIALLREQVKQLYNNWQTLLISNGADDPDVQAARQLFISTLAQYGQANDAAIDTISQTTSDIATELSDTGNFKGAMDAYSQGMAKMEEVFRNQQRQIRRALNAARKAAHTAREAARQAITDAILAGTTIPSDFDFPDVPKTTKKSKREQARRHRRKMIEKLREQAALALAEATREIDRQIAAAIDPAVIAALNALKASRVADFYGTLNSGQSPAGSGIRGGVAEDYGNAAVSEDQLATAQNDATSAENASIQAAADRASQARADAAALRQARLGVAAAWADARGDAVASAKVQVAMAKAALGAARAELAAATTASARSQALVAIYTAQAQLISAVAAVQAAQMDLVQSQYDVTIALATAAGNTVQAASLTLQQARAALSAALKKSRGKATAEVNQARVAVINAEAAARDAKLQDELDTIDFNLQMGKITQSSAIKALQEILRTHELTKAQRRQLLLQIKGMKDELANSQWNFGDIKLPTPYEVRRYITARRNQFRDELDQAATNGGGGAGIKPPGNDHGPGPERSQTTVNRTTITIDGADIGKIRQIIRQVVGDSGSVNTRTTGARRGGVY